MARCLRCKADSSWIEGRALSDPQRVAARRLAAKARKVVSAFGRWWRDKSCGAPEPAREMSELRKALREYDEAVSAAAGER